MIRHKLGRVVQWLEGDAHMVGRVVEGIKFDFIESLWVEKKLIALAHTHELVSVATELLADYQEPQK